MERTITITEEQFKDIAAEACAEETMRFGKISDDNGGSGMSVLIFGIVASAISSKIENKLFPKESDAFDEFMKAMDKVKGDMEHDF